MSALSASGARLDPQTGRSINSLVYYSQQGRPAAACEGFAPAAHCNGSLKLVEFPDTLGGGGGSDVTVSTLSVGKAGFGRDASVAFETDGSASHAGVVVLLPLPPPSLLPSHFSRCFDRCEERGFQQMNSVGVGG